MNTPRVEPISAIRDSPTKTGAFLLVCRRCGLRVDNLSYAEVCRRQDQHDAAHATAEIGLPQ